MTTPVHTNHFCLKTEVVSPAGLAYRTHVSGENVTENASFQKRSSEWVKIFENGGHSFTCGRTKTEVFEYDNVIHHLLLAWRMLCEECYRFSIV